MRLVIAWLIILAGCLLIVLCAVLIPWAVIAWRDLGPEPKHRKRPAEPVLEAWPPPDPATRAELEPDPYPNIRQHPAVVAGFDKLRAMIDAWGKEGPA